MATFGQWLDHDRIRQFVTDPESGIAHLANEVGLPGQDPDSLLLTKTHFAKTLLHVRSCEQLLNADSRACLHLT